MQRREEETYLVQVQPEAKMMTGQCYSSLLLLFVYSSGSCFLYFLVCLCSFTSVCVSRSPLCCSFLRVLCSCSGFFVSLSFPVLPLFRPCVLVLLCLFPWKFPLFVFPGLPGFLCSSVFFSPPPCFFFPVSVRALPLPLFSWPSLPFIKPENGFCSCIRASRS